MSEGHHSFDAYQNPESGYGYSADVARRNRQENYRELLCLAKSRKSRRSCVAGREIRPTGPGAWIRPVSDASGAALGDGHIRLPVGKGLRVGDVVRVPLLRACPNGCHTEDWLIESALPWEWVRRARRSEILACVENPDILWCNLGHAHGRPHSRVSLVSARFLTSSLHLIKAEDIEIRVEAEHEQSEPSRVRITACFNYRGVGYGLAVTDPITEAGFAARGLGRYRIGDALLTISLGEPFTDRAGRTCHYKLVAAVITPEDFDHA